MNLTIMDIKPKSRSNLFSKTGIGSSIFFKKRFQMSLFLIGLSEAATAVELIMLLELNRDSKKDLGSDVALGACRLNLGPLESINSYV